MGLVHRREMLRSLAVGGLAMSSVGRNALALEGNKPDKSRITIGKQTSDITGFDPHLNFSSSAVEIIGNLYETLVTLKGGEPASGLATKWSRDGSTWTFTMAGDRKFASGHPVTAADAAFSFKRALRINNSPALPLAHLGLTAINSGQCITAKGEDLIIALPDFVEEQIVLHSLTSAGCSVLDNVLVQQHGSTSPLDAGGCVPLGDAVSADFDVPYACRFAPLDDGAAWLRFNSAGSGPFQISNAVRTDEVVLQRNSHHPDYINPTKSLPLVLRDIPDPREQQRLLLSGEIQVAWNVADEPADVCASSIKPDKPIGEKLTARYQPRANLVILCMNTASYPLDKANVRKGIRQAIDTNALTCALNLKRWKGRDAFFPSVMTKFALDAASAPFNVEEAGKALANCRCLHLDYVAGSGRSMVANWLANQLACFGVTLDLRPASSGRLLFEKLEKRDHDLALVSFSSDYLHPQSNARALCINSDWEDLNAFDGPHTLAWYCHWRDEKIIDKVGDAAKATTAEAQSHLYNGIQTDLVERGPYAFLLEEVCYVKAVRGALPVIGAIDNQTRYSPPRQA